MENIIFISLAAVIAGAQTWNEIEAFGERKREWLSKFLDMSNGSPSHDTINRFFSSMDPADFESCFRKWVNEIVTTIKDDIISIDGKTIRGNRTHTEKPIHMVSAWSTMNGLSLGQMKTYDKSNEITVIPDLLESLAIEGNTITIDAMGCHTNIASKIVSKNADYILAVKKNQAVLMENIVDSFLFMPQEQYITEHELDHGRIEKRTCNMITDLSMCDTRDQWPGIKSIISLTSERIIKATGEIETATRYYISSRNADPEFFSYAIRSHWGIENNLHWCLDMVFGEDQDRKRNKNAAQNFSLLNKIALMTLKKDTTAKVGLRSRRLMAAWDENYLLGLMKID